MKRLFITTLLLLSHLTMARKIQSFTVKEYASDQIFDVSQVKKKTLINFWATWCTSCIKELDELEALKKKYPSYDFVAISAGDTKKKIKRFLKKHPWSYRVLMDKDKSISKSLGVLNLPQTWVIDEKGEILYKDPTPPKTLP